MNIENIKVGSLVRIKSDLALGQVLKYTFVSDSVYEKRGQVLRVKSIDNQCFNVHDMSEKTWFEIDMVEAIIGEKVTCAHCDKELDSENAKFDCLGNAYCEDCASEVFTVCSECGKELDKNSGDFVLFNDKAYCKGCFDKKFATCEECGEIHEKSKMYKLHNGYVCKSCFDENKYVQCDGCGEYHLKSEVNEYNGIKLCNNCLLEKVNGTIKGYHHYGDWRIKRTDNDGIYQSIPMGFELEVERTRNVNDSMSNDMAAYIAISKSNQLVVCEHDGSLDNGFEIISHPMTMKYLRTKGSPKIKAMLQFLKDSKFTGDRDTSGFHIHVSRDELKTAQRSQEEVIDNIALILETFKDEIMKFARRSSNGYCKFLTDRSSPVTLSYVKQRKREVDGQRYLVLNETNSNTIEFRIFQSTLDFNTFMATFELVNNIVNIAKHKDIDGLKWKDIVGYHPSTNKFIKDYNDSLDIESTAVITVLSNFEKNKKNYTLKQFLKGNFAIHMDGRDSNDVYVLLGTLLRSGLEVHPVYSGIRNCLTSKYGRNESVHVRKFSDKKRLISVTNDYPNDNIVELSDIVDLWCSDTSLVA